MKRNHKGYRVGQCHHRAKFTDDQVAKIRRMYRPGVVGYRTLSKEFGCGEPTIRDIVTHVTRGIL